MHDQRSNPMPPKANPSSPLRYKLLDSNYFVTLYGTTPPRADFDSERTQRAAVRLAKRTQSLKIDGFVIYDVQDESSRTQEPRPFPFLPTQDSRGYSKLVRELSGRETITYKCVAGKSEKELDVWLDEAQSSYDVQVLSLVGSASSRFGRPGVSLMQAIERAHLRASLTVGGVVIPERHSSNRSESLKLIEKAAAGCSYFISQAIYNPEPIIRLLKDYSLDCSASGMAPKRIMLTFTPCGIERTMQFMKWLGIDIPADVAETILSAPIPLNKSLSICSENLNRILDSAPHTVPLGLNIESVSIRKEEIEGSIELVEILQNAM